MKLSSLFLVSSVVLVQPSCKGPGGGGLGPPDLVVPVVAVVESSPAGFGITAVRMKIRVRNKGAVPTTKPFHVSVVVRNPQLKPESAQLDHAAIAAPLSYSLIGLLTFPLQGQTLPPNDLTVSVPLNPGDSVLLEPTIYVRIPWELPLIDPDTGERVDLEVTATADWTNLIQEKDETNNSRTVPFVSL